MAKILIIDDDDAVRTVLALMLTQFGHSVVQARDGKEGLELFRAVGAELVITDIVMPEKEGLEVLMELRKIQPPVKVIAISGGGRRSPAESLHIAKHLGASRVLAKPFSNLTMVEMIDELIASDVEQPLVEEATE